jgi:hypothetical protein
VRELEGPRKPGLHRVQWDLRLTPPEQDEEGRDSFQGALQGPLVRPGTYRVSLNVDDHEASTPITVEPDPEFVVTESDRRERWQVLERLLPLRTDIYRSAKKSGSLKDQLEKLQKSLDEREGLPDELKETVEGLAEELRNLTHRMKRMSSEVTRLYRTVEGSPHLPTETQVRVLGEIETRYRRESSILDELIDTKIPELEKRLNEHQVPRITVEKKSS